jgi:hypothetical protein
MPEAAAPRIWTSNQLRKRLPFKSILGHLGAPNDGYSFPHNQVCPCHGADGARCGGRVVRTVRRGALAKAGVEVLGSVAVVFAILVCDAIGDGCAVSAYILIFDAVPHVIWTMVDG